MKNPMRQSIVYLVQQDSRKNFTGALEYGSIEPLLEEREELDMFNSRKIIDKLRFGLQHMTEDDYIIPIGNPVSIGLAFAIAAEITGGCFNALKYDGQENRYFVAKIDLRRS